MHHIPPEIHEIIIEFALNFATYPALRAVSRKFYSAVTIREPPTIEKVSKHCMMRLTPIGEEHGIQFEYVQCVQSFELRLFNRGKWLDTIIVPDKTHGLDMADYYDEIPSWAPFRLWNYLEKREKEKIIIKGRSGGHWMTLGTFSIRDRELVTKIRQCLEDDLRFLPRNI